MTDRGLLEFAAKAAGWEHIDFLAFEQDGRANVYDTNGRQSAWNPLRDDGDALRLAVKLRLGVCVTSGLKWTSIEFYHHPGDYFGGRTPHVTEEHGSDEYAATRRAIVRAAAEIGTAMG